VIETAAAQRLIGAFREKPTDRWAARRAPTRSTRRWATTSSAPTRCSTRSPRRDDEGSKHDMGGNIVPQMVERKDAAVYDFRDNVVAGESERDRGYWRDVGTLDAFYEAHQDLISVHPIFNLYNYEWPSTRRTTAAAGEVRPRRARPGRATP
jgi:glucose-1-phosphate adenylyltransferase